MSKVESALAVQDEPQEEVKMPRRGRKPKVLPAPKKVERMESVRSAILKLPDSLIEAGYGKMLQPPRPISLIAEPVTDPKTGGLIGHVEEPLGTYIQRVSIQDNFSQRPPFDHVEDPIYRRLIRDFLEGAVMPEAKIAALSDSVTNFKVTSLKNEGVRYSIIDGLQRLYCYAIAILLILKKDALLKEGCITKEAWEYFSDIVAVLDEQGGALENLLTRPTRYEVFWNIDLAGLLHYMVTFNTGQRRMSLQVQLEIMRKPLIDSLERDAKAKVYHSIFSTPGMQKPKDAFAASELVLATQAFITNNPQIKAGDEAERFLNEDQRYLENVGDIIDVVQTLSRITTELNTEIMRVYANDATRRYILSSGGTFFIGLAAACGYIRNRNNMKVLDGVLDKLMDEMKKGEDPLKLEEYQNTVSKITASRGKTLRRLVYDTFLRFFTGATTALEWQDTANQLPGFSD